MAESHTLKRVLQTPLSQLLRGRVTGPAHRVAALEDTDLPEPVRALIRQVVKKTRLWRREKADVTSELIAHFQDGLESGATADDLVHDFGDPRVAAKLIRRAKKRQRPLPWHMLKWTRRGVVGLVAFYILLAVWFVLGEPKPSVDYVEPLQAMVPSAPDGQQAWPLYRQALELLQPRPTDAMLSATPADESWQGTAQYLSAHREEINLLHRAGRKRVLGLALAFTVPEQDRQALPWTRPEGEKAPPVTGTTEETPLLQMLLLPHLGPMRHLAQLLAADARLAAQEDDAQRVVADLVAMQQMADHIGEHPFLVSLLVQSSISGRATHTATELLHERPELFTDEQLRNLAHALSGEQRFEERHRETERLGFADALQHMYSPDGILLDGRITPKGLQIFQMIGSMSGSDSSGGLVRSPLGAAILPAAPLVVAPADEQLRKYDELMQATFTQMQRPTWEQHFEEPILNWSNRMHLRYLPVRSFMVSFDNVALALGRANAERKGLLLGIALTLYRRDHGRWPAELSALAPGYIPEIPMDPVTGGPLIYAVRETGPIVFSVGADGDVDDGSGPADATKLRQVASWLGAPTGGVPNGDWPLWPLAPGR